MSKFSDLIFKRTYAITEDETWEQCARRVSKFVADLSKKDNQKLENTFYDVISQKKFIPGGRYLYSAGRKIPQINNCFLLKAEDSREGWANLVSKHIVALSTGGGVGTEYSSIREKGAPISGFGGTASGPVSLMAMVNEVARQVMAGGKRRSALWAGLNWQHPDIEEFISVKNWSLSIQAFKEKDFNFPAPLDMTNISVGLDDEFFKRVKKDKNAWDLYYKICKSMCKTGEPGFAINIEDKSSETLRNPCQPGWASILTPDGLRKLNDIKIGDKIWSESKWTEVVNKQSSGVKTVYRYRTTAGVFYGTENHKLISKGVKIEAKDCQTVDILSGPNYHDIEINPQDVMDGLVIGDGSVHKASNNLVHLYIGENDQDYFTSEIKDYLQKERKGLNDYAWEVKTTCSYDEVIKLNDRAIPERFIYADKHKIAGFLRGLYSANGSVVGGKRVTLKTTSIILVEQVQQMLSAIGITSYFTTNKSRPNKFSNGTYIMAESYDVNIGADRDIFFHKIGFLQNYKIEKLKNTIYELQKATKSRKLSYDVISVDQLWDEEVFDITVNNTTHTYWTGGLNVSNCNEVVSHLDSDICNLGSVNLSKIKDVNELTEVTQIATTFLYLGTHSGWLPHADFAKVREIHRRIGLGLMGIHEFCIREGEKYAPNEKLGSWLKAWKEASENAADYASKTNIASGTPPIALRALAPNGTISIIGETTSSLEPIFCVAYKRRFLDNYGKWKYNYVIDPTAERLIKEGVKPENIEDAYSLSHDIERRIAMQAFVQQYVDQGISSTINVPAWGEPGNNNCKHFAETLLNYLPKLRGITLYPEGARSGQPLTPVKYETAISHNEVTFEEGEDRCLGGVCGI